MIYDVRQTTSYSYAAKVGSSHHVLCLTPIDRPLQRVHASALDIDPAPQERHERSDFFGNRLTWVRLNRPHDRLTLKVAARIAVSPRDETALPLTPPWEEVREEAFRATDFGARSPVHFVFASRLVSLDPEIRDYVRESFSPGRPILDGAIELMRRINTDFTYEAGVTTVTTTPPMSFALRRGVCQDFAHIMISGLRGLGLAAAYVSGYLRTVRRADEKELAGSDAMHAWVMVYCGREAGWRGLDPTNDLIVSEDHVVIAAGRDYSDVAPVAGVLSAPGRQKIDVAVSVTPVG